MKLNKYMALAGIVATVIPGQALVEENVRTATDNRPVAKVERGVVKLSLKSPDGRQEATFSKEGEELTYSVKSDGKDIILPSRAGLNIDNRTWEMAIGKRDLKQFDVWMEPLTVDSVRYYLPVDTTWHNDFGERSTVRDHYNSATLYMSRKDNSDYKLDVEVRAYDEGIAFRYFFPEHPAAIFHKVTEDLTDYTFPDNTTA